jgi:hypothetical protein
VDAVGGVARGSGRGDDVAEAVAAVLDGERVERGCEESSGVPAARAVCAAFVRSAHSGQMKGGAGGVRAMSGRVMCGVVVAVWCVARAAGCGVERAERPPSRPREEEDRPASGI